MGAAVYGFRAASFGDRKSSRTTCFDMVAQHLQPETPALLTLNPKHLNHKTLLTKSKKLNLNL